MSFIKRALKAMERVKKYFEKLKIPYKVIEVDMKGEKYPIAIAHYSYKNLHFDLLIRYNGNWIEGKCYFLNLRDIPDLNVFLVYTILLELNWLLPETTFSAHERDVFVEFDMQEKGSFDEFKWNLASLTRGLNIFFDSMQKLKEDLVNAILNHLQNTAGKLETSGKVKEAAKYFT